MRKWLADKLVSAALVGNVRRARALLLLGASPDAVDADGSTAVYKAALREDATILRLLLSAGANPNVESTGESDGTPLCGAAACGFSDAVAELLAHGADPNQREDDGTAYSPLLWASRNGHEDVARMLLEAGADPNIEAYGLTPLAAATERGEAKVVQLLLEYGADPS